MWNRVRATVDGPTTSPGAITDNVHIPDFLPHACDSANKWLPARHTYSLTEKKRGRRDDRVYVA
jgi:hypothetical protein